jgi:NAD(P)-dependent dehydrogenase (short-subunit alcohol dehydrogenase family)
MCRLDASDNIGGRALDHRPALGSTRVRSHSEAAVMSGAIIIGTGPGIGTAVARRVAQEGLPVGVIARSDESVEAALAALEGGETFGVTADVTDEVGLRAALDVIVDRFGVPDLLVYNAALIQSDRIGELTAKEQLDAWAVNVVGAITAIAHLAPLMALVGAGTIVITGGMPEPEPELTSLSLGKAGVRTLTELLAKEYGPAGVHVATVTVAGAVGAGTAFDPDDIAKHYWRLHLQQADDWDREIVYDGSATRPAEAEVSAAPA